MRKRTRPRNTRRSADWVDGVCCKKIGLRRALLTWFRKCARDLPWRRSKNPYRIWVSEIMLQQTRIDTVLPYFQRFIQSFPNVQALASAKEDRVLKQWEGLGYYRRAFNLQKTARIIVHEYGGRFPKTVEEWRRLPGVGRYTAGAVTSIAFDVQTPVLDGNIKRILARLFKIQKCVDDGSTIRDLWTAVEELVPAKHPGDFNQAMMELGSRICTPKRPLCDECPVTKLCDARAMDCVEDFPVRQPKQRIPHYDIVAAAIRKNGRYLLGKRPPGGMLSGLWEFPGGKVEQGETREQALVRELEEEIGITIRVDSHITSVDHTYSHFKISLHLYECEIIGGKPQAKYHSEVKWILRSQFDRYAFPAADLKFFDRL
ncbi:MAG: A/G-specific adenine glycosylase [bacterium]